MIIRNAKVYTPQHTFAVQDLVIRNGRIVPHAMAEPGEQVIDADGLYALPAWLISTSTVRWAMISATPTPKACRRLPTLRPAKACSPSAPPP